MGKKKSFIDKKKAVTYNLIYRSTEDADAAPERVLVETDKGVGIGRPDIDAAAERHAAHEASGRRYPPGHPLAWLEEEAAEAEVSDERRRELLELGFPDDGYDYLRHMRTLGRGGASLEGVAAAAAAPEAAQGAEDAFAGPSVFVPAAEVAAPEDDVRLFDASQLTLMQKVEKEEEAAELMGGVTAFAREKRRAARAEARELAELEELMRQMEEEEGDEEGAAGEEGVGDLLDDFVITATEMGAGAEGEEKEEEGASSGAESEDYEAEESDYYSEAESASEEGEHAGAAGVAGTARGSVHGSMRPPAKPGSIASSYWREERHDRKELLAVIDERFEHLALEYDESEIGDLEEQEEEGQIGGVATLDDFSAIIDEFHASHSQSQKAYENNVPYTAPGFQSTIRSELEQHGLSDDDAAVAIQKAHEALRRAEEAERSGGEDERVAVWVEDRAAAERERWDCESVLSLRSNLDNHPGRIREAGSGRRRGAGSTTAAQAVEHGMIKLGRHGIPMGVLPGKPTAAALRRLDAATVAEVEGEGEESGEEGAANGAAGQQRRKGESAEEKKARKAAVKEAKREARVNKKALKEMFKEESGKAQRRAATAQVQAAMKLA